MLTDPRLYRAINRLKAEERRIETAAQTAEDFNDPRSSSAGVKSGKPASRGPGRTNADAIVRRVASLIDKAADELSAAAAQMEKKLNTGHVHESVQDKVTTVGGKKIDEPIGELDVPKKGEHSITVRQRRAAEKLMSQQEGTVGQ